MFISSRTLSTLFILAATLFHPSFALPAPRGLLVRRNALIARAKTSTAHFGPAPLPEDSGTPPHDRDECLARCRAEYNAGMKKQPREKSDSELLTQWNKCETKCVENFPEHLTPNPKTKSNPA